MKKFLITWFGVVFMSGIAMAARSQDLERLFANMDADKDGKVTQKEFTDLWKKSFKNLDKNGDGELDAGEFSDAKSLKVFDSNEDGGLDPAEDHAMRLKHFEALDENSDGVLILQEMLREATY